MESVLEYVKPELMIVAVVLFFIGQTIKQFPSIKHKYIPLILGVVGMVLCAIYVFATTPCCDGRAAAIAAFTSITQGLVTAGLSTYAHQIFKQCHKTE